MCQGEFQNQGEPWRIENVRLILKPNSWGSNCAKNLRERTRWLSSWTTEDHVQALEQLLGYQGQSVTGWASWVLHDRHEIHSSSLDTCACVKYYFRISQPGKNVVKSRLRTLHWWLAACWIGTCSWSVDFQDLARQARQKTAATFGLRLWQAWCRLFDLASGMSQKNMLQPHPARNISLILDN